MGSLHILLRPSSCTEVRKLQPRLSTRSAMEQVLHGRKSSSASDTGSNPSPRQNREAWKQPHLVTAGRILNKKLPDMFSKHQKLNQPMPVASLLHCWLHQPLLMCCTTCFLQTTRVRWHDSCSLQLITGAFQNQELQQNVQEAENQVPEMERRQSLASGAGRSAPDTQEPKKGKAETLTVFRI